MRRAALVLGIALIVIIGTVVIFSIDWGGSGDTPASQEPTKINKLTDLSTTANSAQMIVRGPINSDLEHKSLQITVGQSAVTMELLMGYENRIVKVETFPNNQPAYSAFLAALMNVDFTESLPAPVGVQAEGACATGKKFTFQLTGNPEGVQESRWATSCSKSLGTYGGNISMTRNLFVTQVPAQNYRSFVSGTGLN